jgi:transmembrane sensor
VHIQDERLYLLLDRYLVGEAPPAEAEAVRRWLAEDAEHARLLEDLRLIRRVTAEPAPHSSADSAWTRAAKTLAVSPKPRVLRRLLVSALAAAAVVVALIGGRSVLQQPPRWTEYVTTAGQRADIRLRDGTQVTLAPKSRVRYTTEYADAQRDVYLDGEAYFQVAPDIHRPFRVHTAGSVTEDLGTAFVVMAYGDDGPTEVVVAEGRVAMWSGGREARTTAQPALVLEARDMGRLESNGVATLRRGVDIQRHLAWTTGVLVFNGTPLSDAALVLERWYDVEIRLPDTALAARRLTASFQHEPIDLVLKRIALTLGVRVVRAGEGRPVFLLRKGD